MVDEVWKDFFKDQQTERAFNNSEVWRNYSRAEIERDMLREKRAAESIIDKENNIMESVEQFRLKVSNDPILKAKLKKVAELLEQQPELKAKTDPNFVKGLSLIDFEE